MRPFRIMLAGLAVGIAVGGDASTQEDAVQWLVVIQGEVTGVSANRMRLLTDDTAVAFSDRPARQVDLVAIEDFAAAWAPGGSFAADSPNASLVNEVQGQLGVLEVTAAEWRPGVLDIGFVMLEGGLPADGDRVAITFDTFTEDAGGGGYQGD